MPAKPPIPAPKAPYKASGTVLSNPANKILPKAKTTVTQPRKSTALSIVSGFMLSSVLLTLAIVPASTPHST